MEEYRQIGTRLKGYPEEETRKARILVSSFIQSAEEVEEVKTLCFLSFFNHPSSIYNEKLKR